MGNTQAPTEKEEYAALIGMDWASEKHDVWIHDTDTGKDRHQVVAHTPEALAEWLGDLQARYPGRQIAVCLEQSRGSLIYALMGYDFLTLYPMNPVTLARYREAFSPSRAKDDPSDAKLIAEILELHRDKLAVWKPDDEQTRSLGFLNESRRKAVDLRSKLELRLRATLKLYYPQAIEWVGVSLHTELASAWLLKWPTLEAVQKAKPEQIRSFYYKHNCRRPDYVQGCIAAVAAAKPLTRDAAVITVSSLNVQMLSQQIRLLNRSIKEYDQRIARLFKNHPNAFIFDSFPGAGPALAPRLVSAFGTDRDRLPSPKDMQTYSGIAPVIERSGKRTWTHWRWNSPKFLRQTFHEYAGNSIPFCPWAKAYYERQKERGKGHHAAVRALAFKWIRILHRCWREGVPYDEERYMRTLQQRGSELWTVMNRTPKEA